MSTPPRKVTWLEHCRGTPKLEKLLASTEDTHEQEPTKTDQRGRRSSGKNQGSLGIG